jgi:hypothetical protein
MFLLAANVRHIFSLSKDNNCIALVQNHDPFCGRLLPENDAGSSIASQAVCIEGRLPQRQGPAEHIQA